MNKLSLRLVLAASICFLICGCSSTYIPISGSYCAKVTTWTIGDTGSRISLLGKNKSALWTELWPSLPSGNEGQAWILSGEVLIFIGWAEAQKNPGDKRLMKTTYASRPIDISEEVLNDAVRKKLLSTNAKLSEDFEFDGFKKTDVGVFVILRSLRVGAGFHGLIALPIPASTLSISQK